MGCGGGGRCHCSVTPFAQSCFCLSPLQVITADILHSSSDPPSRTEAAAGLCVMPGTQRGFLESPINYVIVNVIVTTVFITITITMPTPTQTSGWKTSTKLKSTMKSQRLRQVKCPRSCLQGGLEHQLSKWLRLWWPRRQNLETCVNRGKKKKLQEAVQTGGAVPGHMRDF